MRIDSQSGSGAPSTRAARHRRRATLLAVIVVLTVASTAWARPTVVVTLHPYASLVQQIVGDRVQVVQLLPSGASPHTFDPTPSQATAIAGAALIVMNGGVDSWAQSLVAAAAPRAPRLVVTDHLVYKPIQGSDGVAGNPHVWLDPSLMAAAVPLLVTSLSQADPADAAFFVRNGASLQASLLRLDRELTQLLAPYRGAPFVPFHDAWPYFARHYGLDLVASIEPSPGREPSARSVAEAVATLRKTHARAVFDERQLNPRPARVVAEAAGLPLVTLDPLGEAHQSYQALMRANVAAIAGALSR